MNAKEFLMNHKDFGAGTINQSEKEKEDFWIKAMKDFAKQEVDNYKTKLLEKIACEVKKTFIADQDYWGKGCNAACDEIELLINKEG